MLMSTRRHRFGLFTIAGALGVLVAASTVTAWTQRAGTGSPQTQTKPPAKPPVKPPAKPPATAPKPPAAAAQPVSPIQSVRVALGHGSPDAAKRLADAMTGANHDLATALIDIYAGNDDAARPLLAPLAQANALGDAAVELGLLDLRHGRRDEADTRLNAIASNRNFNSPDDLFRLARAATGRREFLLAGDAYDRIIGKGRADVESAFADVLLEREQPADAVTGYKAALEDDPSWIPALVGLSRAFADDDPKQAQAYLDAARKIAPDSPDVWMVIAQRRIEVDDFAGSAEALDKVKATRPGTMDEAALRVALAYQRGGAAEVDTVMAGVKAIDPRSARGWIAAGDQASHNYRFAEAVDFARKAATLDPEDPRAHGDLGTYLMRMGDEGEARTELQRSWDLDKSSHTTKNLLDVLDQLDKFVVVNDGPLVFKFAPEQAAILKPYALPLGEEAYKTFVQHYGFTPKGPILIEIFPEHDQFAVRTIGLPGIVGALGACFGRVIGMDSPTARQPIDFSWHATEWHEMAHVFTLQLSDYRVPRWLTEGISVFEEHRKEPAWGRELTLEFAQELGVGKTFGVKGITEAFKHPENYSMAYFEASLIVEHLVALNGDEGLRTLLKAYAAGDNDDQAFTKAFGKNLDDVDRSFNAFVEQQYGPLRDAMKQPAAKVDGQDLAGLKARAAAAPRNFLSQVSYGQALFRANDFTAAKAPLERAAELAPQASGDGSPHALLAAIAEKAGDNTTARKELRSLLTYDHANVSEARELTKLALAAKAEDDSDYALRRVADLDPFDAEVHGNLGQRLMAKSDFAGALVEFQVALAQGPTNKAEAHANVAEAYLKLNRLPDAKREALEALKEAPTYARAQDLLLAAIGKN
jgi:tetratricopeptide (TPR) repeat protein